MSDTTKKTTECERCKVNMIEGPDQWVRVYAPGIFRDVALCKKCWQAVVDFIKTLPDYEIEQI